jgi:hypothetical protein
LEDRGVIVLDEHLKNSGVMEQISQWYRGRVVNVTSLRPGTVIKDDAIPLLLRQASAPTFVTINTADFWRRLTAEDAYCMICFPLTDDRVSEIPDLLRRLFRFPEFGTKQARCGKVVRVSQAQIQYYRINDNQMYTLAWQTA